MTVIELVVYGWLLHWIADWFFQNEWQAVNKAKRRIRWKPEVYNGDNPDLHKGKTYRTSRQGPWYDRHPAAYVHAGIHTAIQLLIFPWWAALIIGILHLIIDTRSPLEWWGRFTRQSAAVGELAYIARWRDQIAHLVVIALVAQLCGL